MNKYRHRFIYIFSVTRIIVVISSEALVNGNNYYTEIDGHFHITWPYYKS